MPVLLFPFRFATGDLEAFKKQAFVLKEGVEYKIKISFKVRAAVATAICRKNSLFPWNMSVSVIVIHCHYENVNVPIHQSEFVQSDTDNVFESLGISFCVFVSQDTASRSNGGTESTVGSTVGITVMSLQYAIHLNSKSQETLKSLVDCPL